MSLLTRRGFLSLPLLASGPMPAQSSRRRPNVLIVLADDQGWGDLSVHGNTNLATPHIDSLAADGAMLERFFVCPLCAPTRAEFLTGRYHARGGVRGVSTGAERLNLDEVTIADTFKSAGYATGCFGKWHNGTQHPYHPNARGFDEYYGFTSGHWGEYFNPELDHNGRMVRGRGFLADDLTERAMEFMEANRNRPFFCYVPLNTPHSPMQAPEEFYARFADKAIALRGNEGEREDVAFTRAALAMCENIDWNVGRLLAKVDELRLREETIVIYFSDNGPNSWRWNGGMKGRKGSVEEGGVRAPFLIRFPGRIPAGRRVREIAGAIDLLPTLASLAGVPLTSKKPLDGKNIAPLLTGAYKGNWPDRMIFSLQNKQASVRTQRYRFSANGQLFDMMADPGQTVNIAEREPETAAQLARALEDWKREMALGPDDRPFPVGYAPVTMLPARDGVPHGGIRRSSTAPNCSYFTNWKSREDEMTWEIEVGRQGAFAVTVFYTSGHPGSLLEVSAFGRKTSAKITEAFDPPLRGKEHDRVDRGPESYVKDWKELALGNVVLPAGRSVLRLRALEVAGPGVADVRYVRLTRNKLRASSVKAGGGVLEP